MNNPFVSVLMPAYNREKYIEEAIEAVLASTFIDFELIIVDDHSTDHTLEIVSRYAKADNRIKVYTNERNLEQFPNRNKAASLARGTILFCADSDDTIEPDALAYVVHHLNANPEVNFATMYLYKDIDCPTVLKSETAIRKNYFDKNYLIIGPAGTIIKRDFFKKIGGFPEKYGASGDMFYNIKAASNSDVLLLPYVFFKYRRHEGQEINKKYLYLYNDYRYFKDLMNLPELPLTLEEKERLLATSKRNFLFQCLMYIKTTGEIRQTLKAFKLAGIGWRDIVSGILNKPI